MTSVTKTSMKDTTKENNRKTESFSVQSSEKMLSQHKYSTAEKVTNKDSDKPNVSLMMTVSKKTSLSEYRRKQVEQAPLFQQVFTSDNDSLKQELFTNPSILMTGFGMRNLQSLQDAVRLKEDERKRLMKFYKEVTDDETEEEKEEEEGEEATVSTERSIQPCTSLKKFPSVASSKSVSAGTERETDNKNKQKLCLEYLLGLEKYRGEAEEYSADSHLTELEEEVSGFKLSKSKAMKHAQLYLLRHRIFDFFQYILVHLLGSSSENPITFILEFLNKCLLYRSRLGKPPILYEKKHLERLFDLMDRMKAGSIDMNQYVKGITSLGICDFNENPRTDHEGCISKKVFIEEAYEAQLLYLNELIRVRQLCPRKEESSSVSFDNSSADSSGSYFMPSGLSRPLDRAQKFAKEDIVEK